MVPGQVGVVAVALQALRLQPDRFAFVVNLAGYVDGEAHPIELAQDGWVLRDYQQMATDSFWAGGSGVVVLPCGAGKTLVGAAAMADTKTTTLILVTNTVSARQWRDELLKRTTLTEDEKRQYVEALCVRPSPAKEH